MNVILPRQSRFTSWGDLRNLVTSLGPTVLLRGLVKQAALDMTRTGQFTGNEVHTCLNHPIACRLALEAIANGNDGPCQYPDTKCSVVALDSLLSQLNDVGWAPIVPHSGRHYRVGAAKWLRKFARGGCWYPHLAMLHRNHAGKFELARSHLFLRVYLVPCRDKLVGKYVEETGRSLPDPLISAFSSMEHEALLNLVFMLSGGWIDDVTAAFKNTMIADWVHHFVANYVIDLTQWQRVAVPVEQWPKRGLGSLFQNTPFIRLPSGAIVAPDPGLLFSGLSDRMLYRLLLSYEGDDEKLRKIGPRLLGSIFEMHVGKLVEELALYSLNSRAVPEFRHADTTDSADAHLVEGGHLTFFEAKVTPAPRPLEEHGGLQDMFDWLDKLAGKNDTRGPLAQGVAQVGKWGQSDSEAVKALAPPSKVTRVNYVLVAREEVPFMVHWEAFRKSLWRPRLGKDEQLLDQATSFLSVRDLEAAVALLRHAHANGEPRTFSGLLDEWRGAIRSSRGVWEDSSDRRGAGGLQDFIATRYPGARREMPAFMRAALDEMFREVAAVGFGDKAAALWPITP